MTQELPQTSNIEDLQVTVEVQHPPLSPLAIRLRSIWSYLSIANSNIERDTGYANANVTDAMAGIADLIREAEERAGATGTDVDSLDEMIARLRECLPANLNAIASGDFRNADTVAVCYQLFADLLRFAERALSEQVADCGLTLGEAVTLGAPEPFEGQP